MSDALRAVLWLGVLGGGVLAVLALRRAGLPSTYARDLLHAGAGSWALGWPFWNGRTAPLAIAWSVAALLAAFPWLASRSRQLAGVQAAVAEGDERWTGLVLYGFAAAALTWPGLGAGRFAATAALWALALGDGLGGAVGRRFGRRRFAVPGGKRKSLEGSLAVAALASLGVALAARWTSSHAGAAVVLSAGAVAALVEALSPRGSDNVLVPAAVFAWITAVM